MFRSRLNKHDVNSPLKGGTEKIVRSSPLVELTECISKMNTLQQNILISLYPDEKNALGSKSSASTKAISSPAGKSSSKSKQSTDDHNGCSITKFVTLTRGQEEEMIELLRRIAELVVQGEQRAAVDDISSLEQSSNEQYDLQANAIFDYFCEADVLGHIVNITTGMAFVKNGDSSDEITNDISNLEVNDQNEHGRKRRNCRLLPPIPIATQAIQSASILIQNVARATSLYFILSNNKINDLINLPLQQYIEAEQHAKNKQNQNLREKSESAEMSELTTLFISFLKSLAMRMNSETLQFYLTYPVQSKNDVDFNNIQFPLYTRALEFCNPDEDTFVRTTAMNICLNTLRLATYGDPLSMEGSQTMQQSLSLQQSRDEESVHNPNKKKTPDGSSLHVNDALPFRERLVISHFVCRPSHVQALTSATFTKIGQLCSSLEENIREMDRIDWTLSKPPESTANGDWKRKKDDLQIERIRIVKRFHDLAADFQDEILLLGDVLSVGLVPLNEQIIEMMFAAVVYPLVLQPLQLYKTYDSNRNKTKKNQVADVSLAKAAFFVIGSLYHYISHKPFLHLFLTALFHPLAPEASKSLIETDTPSILYVCDNGDIQIKTDKLQNENSLDCYLFGRKIEDTEVNEIAGTKLFNQCTYVLSPALVQLFKAEQISQTLRYNAYRRSFLASLSGTDGMAILQPLAIYAMDAVVATIKPDVLKNIMFGANILPEWDVGSHTNDSDSVSQTVSVNNGIENFMVEIVASMCRSVMITTISPSDVRNLNFNLVASHAICCVALIDKLSQSTALKLIKHHRLDSASFMSQAPSRLNKKLNQNSKEGNISCKASIDEDLKFDRIFFDPFCDGDKFAIENTIRKRSGGYWDGPALISVAKDGCMDDFCKLICKDPIATTNHDTEQASYRCAANSAVAYLQLDAFEKFLNDDFDQISLEKQKGYLGVSAFALFNNKCDEGRKNKDRVLLSPLPPPFSLLLFDEDTSLSEASYNPQIGTIVKLVGRTAFPCVCEVTKEFDSLFSDGDASVVADGIRWQSLWMVLMGKFMILAEPVSNDSGGNGLVIASYPLCCITAERDNSADILQNTSPARRLLLTHFSPSVKPPSLFVIDTTDRDQLVNSDEVQIIRSVMDLWFEDTNAAATALKALNSKIAKARSQRGHNIREALQQEDQLRFQSLLNGNK